MCQRVTCPRCGKPTFSGCGRHVEEALAGVPREKRCACPPPKTLVDRLGESLRFRGGPLPRVLLLLALLAGPAPSLRGAEKVGTAKPSAAKPTLLFFMNPAGRPCQTQERILAGSRVKWEAFASLRYVRTDVAADRDAFYSYGVRSLPNLILVAPDGKEITRYSPGIQPVDAILSGISGKPAR